MSIHPLVVLANYYQFKSNQIVKQPCVESRMFLSCESGRGRVYVAGHWHEVQQDDFFILPWRHTIHYQADQQIPFLLSGIHVIPDALKNDNLNFYNVAQSHGEKIP